MTLLEIANELKILNATLRFKCLKEKGDKIKLVATIKCNYIKCECFDITFKDNSQESFAWMYLTLAQKCFEVYKIQRSVLTKYI